MADRAEIQNLLTDLYAARKAGSLDGMMALIHDDAALTQCGDVKFCTALGCACGVEEVRAALGMLIDNWTFNDFAPLTTLIDGESAAVRLRVNMTFKPTKEPVDTELFHLWTFRDGKVATMTEFLDTALVNAMMTKVPRDAGAVA